MILDTSSDIHGTPRMDTHVGSQSSRETEVADIMLSSG